MSAGGLRDGPVAAAIRRHRLVAVLRRVAPRAALLALVDELVDAGVRVFEITLDAPSGAQDLRAVRDRFRETGTADAMVGAGTVLSAETLAAARDAGADFAVSPVLDVALVREAVEGGLPFVPGALTPTEIVAAWAAGATLVKLFPASAVGPALVRELRGPLPDVPLLPTGGIDASNAADFLAAGAVAVGVGSAMTKADAAGRRAIIQATRA